MAWYDGDIRGELTSPLGPSLSFDLGAGALSRGTDDGRSMLRGAPDVPPLRGMLADGGRGTLDREAISGADERGSGRDIGATDGLVWFEFGPLSGIDRAVP